MIKKFPFRLDIEKEYNNRIFSVNSNDLQTVKFTFVITDNGIPLNLTGLTVRIAIRKPDKKAVWQDCTITNAPKGEGEVVLNNQAYVKKGEYEAELMLYKGTDTVAITQKFYYRSAEGIMNDKSLQSQTVLGPIDQKLSEVEATIRELQETGTGIDAKARQDIQSVTTQLADTAKKNEVIGKAKDDNGGVFPVPFRVPTLGVEKVYPNRQSPYIPVWVEGNTIYAYGKDNTLRKSTDKGVNWVKRGYNAWGFGSYSSFLKTKTGTLLNIAAANPPVIQRSTDDGTTWTNVFTYRTGTVPLGAQSWCLDPDTGHIYMGEYNNAFTDDIRLWVSKDDGITWETVASWPGENTPVGTPNKIRHIHSVQWDHIAKRVVISCGDSTPDTGLWRTNATGEGVEKIVTNSMVPVDDIDVPRSIGIMPFKDYIAWAGDTTQNPYLSRIARSEIGKANPKVEKVYRLNSAAWFTCRASDDGNRWVLCASEEGNSLDNLVHLYAVEDQGASVWEVGAIPAPLTSPAASLQPVGIPEQGETFYMVTRGFGDFIAWQFRLGKGVTSLPKPEPLPDVLVPQTASAGFVTLPPQTEQIFHVSVAGGFARKLHIFESNIGQIDLGTATAGAINVFIRERGTTTNVFTSANFSERQTSRQDMGMSLATSTFSNGKIIEFVVRNNHPAGTVTCCPSVTFGWGTV